MELRGLAGAGISNLEHLALAEAIAGLETSIAFPVFATSLLPAAVPKLRRFAALLRRHPALKLSIEAHLRSGLKNELKNEKFSKADFIFQRFFLFGVSSP